MTFAIIFPVRVTVLALSLRNGRLKGFSQQEIARFEQKSTLRKPPIPLKHLGVYDITHFPIPWEVQSQQEVQKFSPSPVFHNRIRTIPPLT